MREDSHQDMLGTQTIYLRREHRYNSPHPTLLLPLPKRIPLSSFSSPPKEGSYRVSLFKIHRKLDTALDFCFASWEGGGGGAEGKGPAHLTTHTDYHTVLSVPVGQTHDRHHFFNPQSNLLRW